MKIHQNASQLTNKVIGPLTFARNSNPERIPLSINREPTIMLMTFSDVESSIDERDCISPGDVTNPLASKRIYQH